MGSRPWIRRTPAEVDGFNRSSGEPCSYQSKSAWQADFGAQYAACPCGQAASRTPICGAPQSSLKTTNALEEMILGVAGGGLFYAGSTDQNADGSRLGAGYALRSVANPAESAIFVLADPQGGETRYDVVKASAFLQRAEEIAGLGRGCADWASQHGQQPRTVHRRVGSEDQLVLQVLVPDHVWRGAALR